MIFSIHEFTLARKTPFDSGREYLTTLISCARPDENDLKTTQSNLSMVLPAQVVMAPQRYSWSGLSGMPPLWNRL